MKISVISATFNRSALLDRALYTYSKQTLPFDEWEYLIADDASQDDTTAVVKKWRDKGLRLRYFNAPYDLNLPKELGQWRDGCKVRNAVSTWAFGEVLVATHPEIMIPPNALEVMYEVIQAAPKAWATAIPYWLPEGRMPAWKKDLHNLRSMDNFYDPSWPEPLHSPGAPDYRNENQENRDTWESEVFWAMEMGLWRWLGGFREFDVWGSVDMDFLARRQVAGIPTVIAQDPDSPAPSGNLMVYHQYHDESPRDMDKAMEAMKEGQDYSTVERMRAQGGLYPIYNHGHRERATDGVLGGVLQDHVLRYQWADQFCDGDRVLDLGCGTGYGSHLLTSAAYYVGVDIDAESVNWANKHYDYAEDRAVVFTERDATDTGLADDSIDQIVCFEVLEHVEDQAALVAEMHRVLKPGGNFIVSTPQLGATNGTPWDKYMLNWEALLHLFSMQQWKDLDPFYQDAYGGPHPVKAGTPPEHAQIMILGGTKI